MLYLNKPTEETAEPILTNSISQNACLHEKCVSLGSNQWFRNLRGSKSPKTPQNWPE